MKSKYDNFKKSAKIYFSRTLKAKLVTINSSPQMKAMKRKISLGQTLALTQPTKKARMIGIKTRGTSQESPSKTAIPSDVNIRTQKRSYEKAVESESSHTEPRKKRTKKVYNSEPRELRPRKKKVSYVPEKLSRKPKNPAPVAKFEIISSSCTKITAEERGPAFVFVQKGPYSADKPFRIVEYPTHILEDELSATAFID